jgi:hypothetical protein
MRKLILAATGIAALAVPAIAPMMASAASPANQTYSVGTHSAGHMDTTGVPCPACVNNPTYGPVWAYDNLNLKYVVTPLGPGQWNVAVTSQGSFAGFANPTTGAADTNNGSTNGTITYTVTSDKAPTTALVPAQEPNGTSIRLPIMQMFSTDASHIGGGDHYNFTYNKVDGKVYNQIA